MLLCRIASVCVDMVFSNAKLLRKTEKKSDVVSIISTVQLQSDAVIVPDIGIAEIGSQICVFFCWL